MEIYISYLILKTLPENFKYEKDRLLAKGFIRIANII